MGAKEKRFVRLGEKAFSFSDPFSGLVVRKNEIVELDNSKKRRSKKIKDAIRGGHLERVSERDYNAFVKTNIPPETEEAKELTLADKLTAMKKDELQKYYEDNYEVTEEEIDDFEALKKDQMIDELMELAGDQE